ncbi:hypothetical protein CGLO_15584 [Colletotrichum gloeosporioides Cg-14]|uniref:Uncharacterized protein n=1 Tax=Colletotrichum gloeosporioides (strain Cg-14) TaxID=1237896 RepID=T0JYN1_COLGC|nr:hypothetical protein CGLO_15584 [Colletotrichum gloeosporioides Cg-14]
MCSLGLPGPNNFPPANPSLNRAFSKFLSQHNLNSIWSHPLRPAIFNAHTSDHLAEARLTEEDSITTLWLAILSTHIREVEPVYTPDELLIQKAAFAISVHREWTVPRREEAILTLAAQNWLVPCKRIPIPAAGCRTLPVVGALANTRYFLGLPPGSPILAYRRHRSLEPHDRRNFAYKGRVPHPPAVRIARMRHLAGKVASQVISLLAFDPNNPSGFTAPEYATLLTADLDDGVSIREVHARWIARFEMGQRTAYSHALQTSSAVKELASLILLTKREELADEEWAMLAALADVVTWDRPTGEHPVGWLNVIAKTYHADEAREVFPNIFEGGIIDDVLVYHADVLLGKTIHEYYAQKYTGAYVDDRALFVPDILHNRVDIAPVALTPDLRAVADRLRAQLLRPADPPKPESDDEDDDDQGLSITVKTDDGSLPTSPIKSSHDTSAYVPPAIMSTPFSLRGLFRPTTTLTTPFTTAVRAFTTTPAPARRGASVSAATPEYTRKILNLKQHLFARAPPPLRMARNRHLRHWTIHRAWLLLQRQQREARERELYRMHQGMYNAAEELRHTAGPGTRDEGWLYRISQEKKGVYGAGAVPIEYARYQTETPARVAWNHDWKR